MNQPVWGTVQQDMSDLLRAHPDDVPGVVAQLSRLQELLTRVPPLRPLCDFNRLYLAITETVLEHLYSGEFNDPAFLARLDVEFAARYFDALRAWHGPGTSPHCPRAWATLFQRSRCHPHAAAGAGLTVHITYDLPFALVTTFDHRGTDPADDSDQHDDYLHVTEIFANTAPGPLDHWQLLTDTMTGRLDDCWQGDPQTYTRNVPWRTAQTLWPTRHDLPTTDHHRTHLDHTATNLGRLLLSPPGDFLLT